MNQQDTISPFCKSVKILYSGCKETLQWMVFWYSVLELIFQIHQFIKICWALHIQFAFLILQSRHQW